MIKLYIRVPVLKEIDNHPLEILTISRISIDLSIDHQFFLNQSTRLRLTQNLAWLCLAFSRQPRPSLPVGRIGPTRCGGSCECKQNNLERYLDLDINIQKSKSRPYFNVGRKFVVTLEVDTVKSRSRSRSNRMLHEANSFILGCPPIWLFCCRLGQCRSI